MNVVPVSMYGTATYRSFWAGLWETYYADPPCSTVDRYGFRRFRFIAFTTL
jgi:hypothetical protein